MRNVVETYCATSLTKERAVPSGILSWECKVIVPPHGKSKNQEDHRRKEDVHLQGKGGNWRKTGRDENYVSEKGGQGNDERANYEPNVGPLSWWTENLRQLCPMNA
jgi:hypothetical protein